MRCVWITGKNNLLFFRRYFVYYRKNKVFYNNPNNPQNVDFTGFLRNIEQ